jgi:hypothetical protein
MNDAFELLDPSNAQAFLKHFDADARRKGQACFQRGCVLELLPKTPGMTYSAQVDDDQPYEVDLGYDSVEGWSGSCSCSREFDCAHVFAAMRALLAEHSSAVVRSLSASLPTSAAGRGAAPKPGEDAGVARRLMAALGRPLNALETKFIRKIHSTYARCVQLGHITRWDFEEMGLRLGGYGWDSLHIWPSFPVDEHEFWLYVARAAQVHQVPIPEFMLPVTDFKRIEERIARWERTREIEKWKQTLGNLQLHHPPAGQAVRGETDLRIVVEETEARLQWRRPGHETFETIKPAQIHKIAEDERRGWLQLATEAALLWQLISPRFRFRHAGRPGPPVPHRVARQPHCQP